MLLSFSAGAQILGPQSIENNLRVYGPSLFNDLATETGGFALIDPDLNIGQWSIYTVLSLPGYYNLDLLRGSVQNMISGNWNLRLVEGWKHYMEGYTLAMRYREDYIFLLYYMTDRSALSASLIYSP